MRPQISHLFFTNDYLNTLDPIIPPHTYAVDIDTKQAKLGDGIHKWSDLVSASSLLIVNKLIQTSRDPNDNEGLVFCSAEDKYIFRLIGCHLTETECASMATTVYPNFSMIIEIDDSTEISTGRFKLGDGVTEFGDLPWFGVDFNPGDFSVGESIEFNGSGWDPVVYLKPTQLQSAASSTGKFHRDDGTWANVPSSVTEDDVLAYSIAFGG